MSGVGVFAHRKAEMDREKAEGCAGSPAPRLLLYKDLFVLILYLIFWVNFASGLICSLV